MLTITLLGTAATMPLPDRALSTAFAACGGHGLLWDCGEGTQAAAHRAGVNLMRADAICLTIGWSKKDDTWTRLNANSLQNYFSSAQDSSDDEVLFYTVTLNVPTDPDTVSADLLFSLSAANV